MLVDYKNEFEDATKNAWPSDYGGRLIEMARKIQEGSEYLTSVTVDSRTNEVLLSIDRENDRLSCAGHIADDGKPVGVVENLRDFFDMRRPLNKTVTLNVNGEDYMSQLTTEKSADKLAGAILKKTDQYFEDTPQQPLRRYPAGWTVI